MTFQLGLPEISIGVTLLAVLQFLGALVVSERFKAYLQKQNAEFSEKLRWDFKVREQAARVAEYLVLATTIQESDSKEDHRMADRLGWELGMWLPTEVYKAMRQALANPDVTNNVLSVIIDVRKVLLKDTAGDLNQNDLMHGFSPDVDYYQ